jgi:hypothetical protein
MTEQTFYHAVNQISQFLGGTKDVPLHTKAAWFAKVQAIPDEAIDFIVGRITDESDSMPKNLPKVFREKFLLWLHENPDKAARKEQNGCRDCEGGILFLERESDGKTACVFCRCYRGNAGVIGRASLYDMQTKGWRSTKAATIVQANQAAKDKAHGHMAGAKKAESEPNPLRYDGYEDRQDEEHW